MVFISVTRLRVRSFIYLPQLLWDRFKSVRQAKRSSGFLGGRLLVNAKNVFLSGVWLPMVRCKWISGQLSVGESIQGVCF
jgi:hypothetical protein